MICRKGAALLPLLSRLTALAPQGARGYAAADSVRSQWKALAAVGHAVNPCNSRLHPAVTEAGMELDGDEEQSVQEAYTPDSQCFGCGPSSEVGLHLRSYRVEGGLEATLQLDKKYQAFPGIVNGGIVSALFDCHGNWSAAVALMDRACLPRPPLTLTRVMQVEFLEPTPPEQELVVRSSVTRVRESEQVGGGKATVEVSLTLHQVLPTGQKLLATGNGLFKKLGALRAL